MLQEPKKILLVKNRALGDSVLGLSSIQYLKEIFKEAQIYYALPEWILPLYKSSHDERIIFTSIDSKNFKGSFAFFKFCLKEKFDVIIELNQAGSSGKLLKLLSFLTSVPYFFHNHQAKSKTFIIDQGKIKPNIQRDLDCIYSVATKFYKLNLPIPNFLHYAPAFPNQKTSDQKNFAVFGMVATRETKCWPVEYFLELGQLLIQNKTVEKIIIPLSKSKMDTDIYEKIKNKLPAGVEIIQVPLDQILNHLEGAKFYIGNDTGLKHICAALGGPTITFFGPEDPLEWHPYDLKKHHYFFKDKLECRTQISHFCPLATCESMICLNQFKPKEIFEKTVNLF